MSLRCVPLLAALCATVVVGGASATTPKVAVTVSITGKGAVHVGKQTISCVTTCAKTVQVATGTNLAVRAQR